MKVSIPDDMTRCAPSKPCPQKDRCARANADDSQAFMVAYVDSSICLKASWCPMFIDVRHPSILEGSEVTA